MAGWHRPPAGPGSRATARAIRRTRGRLRADPRCVYPGHHASRVAAEMPELLGREDADDQRPHVGDMPGVPPPPAC
jgi:hypothetical protein